LEKAKSTAPFGRLRGGGINSVTATEAEKAGLKSDLYISEDKSAGLKTGHYKSVSMGCMEVTG
jgi:hypothetical protein